MSFYVSQNLLGRIRRCAHDNCPFNMFLCRRNHKDMRVTACSFIYFSFVKQERFGFGVHYQILCINSFVWEVTTYLVIRFAYQPPTTIDAIYCSKYILDTPFGGSLFEIFGTFGICRHGFVAKGIYWLSLLNSWCSHMSNERCLDLVGIAQISLFGCCDFAL